ncbi:MAG: hypothetical protein ACXVXD_13530, partial [Nocardioidaceae bacterium]
MFGEITAPLPIPATNSGTSATSAAWCGRVAGTATARARKPAVTTSSPETVTHRPRRCTTRPASTEL